MEFKELPLYFANGAGTVREHPNGYAVICYAAGPRQGPELARLLTQVGRLLRAREWHCVLSDQRLMLPYTLVEEMWTQAFWNTQRVSGADRLHLAILVAPPAVDGLPGALDLS